MFKENEYVHLDIDLLLKILAYVRFLHVLTFTLHQLPPFFTTTFHNDSYIKEKSHIGSRITNSI